MSKMITRAISTDQLNPLAESESVSALQRQELNFAISRRAISKRQICCCYTNHTTRFQIIRIPTIAGDFIERTVFPLAQVSFEANPLDRLEVHTGSPITSIHSDTIPCYRLTPARAYSLTKISYAQKRLFSAHFGRTIALKAI